MSDDFKKFGIEETDDQEFIDFFDQVEAHIGGDSDIPAVAPPDSQINARNWLLSVVKVDKDIDYFNDVYIPKLMERYINPVKEKIESLNKTKDFLRRGIRDFMEAAQEKKVVFPEIATVTAIAATVEIVYPEDEKEFAKKLHQDDSEYIRVTPSLDKKKIKEEFKKTGKIPVDGLSTREVEPTIRIVKVKEKVKEADNE